MLLPPPSKPIDWFPLFPVVGIVVACAAVAIPLMISGEAAAPIAFVLILVMIITPSGFACVELVRAIKEMKTLRGAFFFGDEQRRVRREKVVNAFCRCPLDWIKDERLQLQYAMDAQGNRLSLIIGKPGDIGFARVLVGGLALYLGFKVPMDSLLLLPLLFVCLVSVGLGVVYVMTFGDLEKMRALILCLDLAQHRLESAGAGEIRPYPGNVS